MYDVFSAGDMGLANPSVQESPWVRGTTRRKEYLKLDVGPCGLDSILLSEGRVLELSNEIWKKFR